MVVNLTVRKFCVCGRLAMFAAMLAMVSALAIFGGGARLSAQETAASPEDLKALLAHLQTHYQQTNSFSASFKETVARVGALPQERSGRVDYLKPGRVRFEFGEPQPETIVSDGKLLYDYDPGLNQVMETPLKNAIKTQAVAAFLLGAGNVERDFKASRPAAPVNDGLIHVLLTPKRGGDPIELGLEPHTLNIASLRLADALGNVTKISFSDIDINAAVEPGRFNFATPAGADVVTQSGSDSPAISTP
jgi:outer membrane lipoprotein carrier protein